MQYTFFPLKKSLYMCKLTRMSLWLSLQLLISAQVLISWFVSLSPTPGSVQTAQGLLGRIPACLSVCVSLSFKK